MGWLDRTRLHFRWIVAGWLSLAPCIATPVLVAQGPESVVPTVNRRMLVVLGAEGEPAYGEAFRTWGQRWQTAANGFESLCIDGTSKSELTNTNSTDSDAIAHRARILEWVASASEESSEHWLVLIGHGTHDSKNTHFNLQGPDLSAADLAQAMANRPGKWVVVVCASASAPFLKAISGPERIVITATKSGAEENYSRFGDFLSQSLVEEGTDLDHDSELSLLEVFLAASQRVEKYYQEKGLLPTEQALLDDNGDGRGTPALFYRGVRAVKAPAADAALDGSNAHRVRLRTSERTELSQESQQEIDRIESAIEVLRGRKKDMDEDEYYQELEQLLLRIASLRGILKP